MASGSSQIFAFVSHSLVDVRAGNRKGGETLEPITRIFLMNLRLLTFSFLLVFCSALQAVHETKPLTEKQLKAHKLDGKFFKKGTEVEGILIATSDRVSDYAHAESAYLFGKIMQSIDKKVAQRIREKRVLCILIGHAELTSEVPQFRTEKKGKELDFYNWRSRGFLRWFGPRPVVVFAEEDVMEYEGGMRLESILIHEFGHVIHGAGFDEDQQNRLTAAFEKARELEIWNDGRAAQRFRRVKGTKKVSLLDALKKWFPLESEELLKKCLQEGDVLVNGKKAKPSVEVNGEDKVLVTFGGPKRCYASRNRSEYWAEGVQCWYNTNRTMDHDHNHVHTRKQLKEYDVELAKLCSEVLGEGDWRFVSPRERAGKGHLKGYDPQKAPVTKDLPHIETAALDYYDKYWKVFWHRLYDKHGLSSPHSRSLFNGKDLSGWSMDVPALDKKPEGKKPFVSRDGMLVSLGSPGGHLLTDEKFENYRVIAEYRFAGKPGNCGVLVHASKLRNLYKMFPKSIEVQMNHKHAGDFWCIVENIVVPDMVKRRGPEKNWGITEGKARRIANLTDDSEKPVGEWNRMRIECVGDEVKVWVNGDMVNHGFDCTAKKGRLAIQAEGSEVEFRKFELTPINVLSE